MSKSGRVRLSDLRTAYRLIHDCRDVGLDPACWPTVLAEGLAPLFDTQVVVVGRIILDRGKPPRNVLLADRGWDAPHSREIWYDRQVIKHDYRGIDTFPKFLSVLSGLTTRTREQLVDDAQWYRSMEFNEVHRPMGQNDLLVSSSVSDTQDSRALFALIILRPLGDPLFKPHQRRLLHLLQLELALHIGKNLVLDRGAPFAELPPRLRRTLECLLEGDSEKQVALRLGLSQHTIHEYAKDLHSRLGVSSRAELLALCLKRLSGHARIKRLSSPKAFASGQDNG